MSGLDVYREIYPDLSGLDDRSLLAEVGSRIGSDPEELAQAYGVDLGSQRGDFLAGVGAGVDSMQATGYGLAAMAGDALERTVGVGEGVRDWGIEGYQRDMLEVANTFKDDTYTFDGATSSLGNATDAAQYWMGYAIPSLATAAVSGGVGGLATKQLVKEASKRAIQYGAGAAMLAQSTGQATGGIYGQAVEEAAANGQGPESVNLGRVAGYGLASGALDVVGGVATLGAARLGPMANLMDWAAGGKARQVVARGLGAAGVESLTEGVQTGLEDMGAGATAEEANFMDPTSMMAGALGGGPVGAIGGALTPTNRPSNSQTDLDAEMAAENAELEAQAAATEQAEAARVEQSVNDSRDTFAETFIPLKDFASERKKQQTTQLEADVMDPNTELGAQFRDFRHQNGIFDPVEKAAAAKKFIKDMAPPVDDASVREEWLTALDQHSANMLALEQAVAPNPQAEMDLAQPDAAQAAPTQTEPAVREDQDGQLELPLDETQPAAQTSPTQIVAEIAASRGVQLEQAQLDTISQQLEAIKALPEEQSIPAIRALVANVVGIKTPASKAAATPKATQKPTAELKPEPAPITMATPVRRRTEAIAKADALLPEGWVEMDQYSDVAGAVNGNKFNIKKFNTALEKSLNPEPEVAIDETPVETPAPLDATPLEDVAPKNKKTVLRRSDLRKEAEALFGKEALENDATLQPVQKALADSRMKLSEVKAVIDSAKRSTEPNTEATPAAKDDSSPVVEGLKALETQSKKEKAEVASRTVVDRLFSPEVEAAAKLSPQESSVWRVLRNAFEGGTESDFVAPDGSFRNDKIAEAAGLTSEKAKNSINTIANRAVTKLAKAQDITPGQFVSALRNIGSVSNTRSSEVESQAIVVEEADPADTFSEQAADDEANFDPTVDLSELSSAGSLTVVDSVGGSKAKGAGVSTPTVAAVGQYLPYVREGKPIPKKKKGDKSRPMDMLKPAHKAEIKSFIAAGMTDAQITSFYDTDSSSADTDTTVTEAAKTRDTTWDAQLDNVLKSKSGYAALKAKWDEFTTTNDPAFEDLTAADKRVWATEVMDFLHHRDDDSRFSRLESAVNDIISTTDAAERSYDGQANTAEDDKVSGASADAAVREDRSSTTGKAPRVGGQTDSDTGASSQNTQSETEQKVDAAPKVAVEVKAKKKLAKPAVKEAAKPAPKEAAKPAPKEASPDNRSVAQQISDSDPTPKELRNQKAFKESYAQKDGYNKGMWENPNLAETAAYADWLGSLTDAQWDVINPIFTNERNPFKNASFIDAKEVQATLQAALDKAANTEKDGQAIFDKAAKGVKPRFSVGEVEAEAAGVTATAIRNATKWFIGEERKSQVIVVRNPLDLIGLVMAGQIPLKGTDLGPIIEANPFGFVLPDDKGVPYAYFFTENTVPGHERANVVHEIGGHIGMDSLTADKRAAALQQIEAWAAKDDGSLESELAKAAKARVAYAESKGGVLGDTEAEIQAGRDSEHIAYFLEEAILAGVNPTVPSNLPLQRFVHRLYQTFKRAVSKFTGKTDVALFAEDFLDLARGAAHLKFVKGGIKANKPSFGMNAEETQAKQQGWVKKHMGGPNAVQFTSNLSTVYENGVNATKFLSRFIRDTAESIPSLKVWYDKMLEAEQTYNTILSDVEGIANRARQLTVERRMVVNDFIGTSTHFQKWGYDPKFEGKTVKIDPIMRKKFERLSAEEQQIVKDVFQHGADMQQSMNDIAKELGVSKKLFHFHSKLDGPYAPLKRFGNYVAVLRSQQLLDAEKALRADDNKVNRDKVEKLKSDGEHYVVSFFDTPGAAAKFAKENDTKYASAESSVRAEATSYGSTRDSQVYNKVLAGLKTTGLAPDAKAAVEKMLKDMYLQSLDERSARLAGARRLNRAGYDKDLMRSFISHGRSQARLISQMKHGAEINTALVDAQKEVKAGGRRAELQPIFNLVARKYANVLTPNNGVGSAVSDYVLAYNTTMMLTSSIGYHVQNMTQPMKSAGKIYGDFNTPRAWTKLFKGLAISRNVVNTSIFKQLATTVTVGLVDMNNTVEIDINKAPPQHRKLLEIMQFRKQLDVGMEEDLNMEDRFDTGYASLNAVGDGVRNITHRLYQIARYVEAQNRVASAIAAYDVAKADPRRLKAMNMTAEEYAISVIEDTHGVYSSLESPLVIDALPRVTTQFRKYQLMMAWMYADAAKKAFAGETSEIRWAGRRTLAAQLGQTAILAGAGAVPFAASIAGWVLAFAGDEDEPEDPERWLQSLFPEDPDMANLIARGVPAWLGLDMSIKLNESDMFMPYNPDYVQFEPTRSGVVNYVAQLGLGPTATTLGNFGNAADFATRGDLFRTTEYLVPRGARSFMESFRYSEDGYTKRNGDVLVDPRQFDAWDLISNAMGLPSTKINQIKFTVGQQYEMEQWFGKESGRIKREYGDARLARDRETQRALRDEFRELQRAKDRVRPFFNGSNDVLKKQSVSSLNSAIKTRRKAEQRAQGTLRFND